MTHVRSSRGRHRSARTRADRVREVCELRAAGLNGLQIAQRLGMASTTVYEYLADPTGERAKARKWAAGGTCRDCGNPTYGGESEKPERCQRCRKKFERQQKLWTRERIIEAIQNWAREYGRPPSSSEWQAGGQSPVHHPPRSNVYWHPSSPFSSWAEAIEAAGFPRPRVGRPKVAA